MILFVEVDEALSTEEILGSIELLKELESSVIIVVGDIDLYSRLIVVTPIDNTILAVLLIQDIVGDAAKHAIYNYIGAACGEQICKVYSATDLCLVKTWNVSGRLLSAYNSLSAAWSSKDLARLVSGNEWGILEEECDGKLGSPANHISNIYKSFAYFLLDRLVYEEVAGKSLLYSMGNVSWLDSLELKEFLRFIDDLGAQCRLYRSKATALTEMVVEMSKDYQILREVAYKQERNARVSKKCVIEVLVWLSAMFVFKATLLSSTRSHSAAFLSAFRAVESITDALLIRLGMLDIRKGLGGFSLYAGDSKVYGFGEKWKMLERENLLNHMDGSTRTLSAYISYRNKLLLAHGLAHVNNEIAQEFLYHSVSFVRYVCDKHVSRSQWAERYNRLDRVFGVTYTKRLTQDIVENTGGGNITWYPPRV